MTRVWPLLPAVFGIWTCCVDGVSGAQSALETVLLIGDSPVNLPEQNGTLEFLSGGFNGKPCVQVGAQQRVNSNLCRLQASDSTKVSWWWKKQGGQCCLIQLLIVNDSTGQSRWFGYCAGRWSEPPSPDPTVEVSVAETIPTQWTQVTRDLLADVRRVLGWQQATVVGLALSPWDTGIGWFAQLTLTHVVGPKAQEALRKEELKGLIAVGGTNPYQPPRLRKPGDRYVEFEYAFEQCAPGRNSHANEWGAFGSFWGPVQAMGRRLRVRYPLFDLVFFVDINGRPFEPMESNSLRLGLVQNRIPAVWGRWSVDGVEYQVTAMTVQDPDGAFDLYKLEMKNLSTETRPAGLVAGWDGPPGLQLDSAGADAGWSVLRGQGSALAVVSPPDGAKLDLREFGVCDRRAKGYHDAPAPGKAEPTFQHRRVGLDGCPVAYRAKVEKDKAYTVFLGGSTHDVPKTAGELVHKLSVEGAAPKTFDYSTIHGKDRPMLLRFEDARDTDGDGFIEVRCESDPASRRRETFLNTVCIFPAGTEGLNEPDIWQGKLNAKATHHIDVGVTPEMGWANDDYDMSDVGIAQFKLRYCPRLAPGQTAVRWLKVPPIHRREMLPYNIRHHAFAQVLPGEGIPPYDNDRVACLSRIDPAKAEQSVLRFWEDFFASGAQFDTPSDILNAMYQAQLSTMAIHLRRVRDRVAFVACGPFNYYDFAYRDHAYQVQALNLAGRHDLAREVTHHYCMNQKDIPAGPMSFANLPLTLGLREDGLWFHRPGQWDAQGQSLWCLIEQWKLTGDDAWLKQTLYPTVRRAAQWIIDARAKHKAKIRNADDPRYGLFPGGAMEVGTVAGEGEHLFYLSAWGVFGMKLCVDAAKAVGAEDDARRYLAEYEDFKACLTRSYAKTFQREDLYRGVLSSSVETEHQGMAGFWTFTPLVYPCQVFAPHDPLMTATLRRMETYAQRYGSGQLSEGSGGFWPYISVDWGIGYILRGEADRAIDIFCAYVDNAGPTLGWAEGYSSAANSGGGDQPHGWACAQYVHFFRQMLLMEQDDVLHIAPATPRSWLRGPRPIRVKNAPTHFGNLTYTIQPDPAAGRVVVDFSMDARKRPRQIVVHLRLPDGLKVRSATVADIPISSFMDEVVLLNEVPARFRLVASVR